MDSTIIWVEANFELIDPVVKPLERDGHNIVRLHTVQEALAAVEQIRQADLILLALRVPFGTAIHEGEIARYSRFGGIELLRELRQGYGVTTPTIAFTVARDEELDRQLWELGVVEIVRKPILPSALREHVRAALRI